MIPSILSVECVFVDGQHTGYNVSMISYLPEFPTLSRFFGSWEFDFSC